MESGSDSVPAVECRGVWKIFGPDPKRALAALRAEGLSKAELLERHKCVVGVADASFAVVRGEIFCVMGLSGSGKSTLVRHINGLVRPTAGEVMIDGEPIAAKRAAALRALRARKIGMVFQNFALLPHRNVVDNVAFGLELRNVPRPERLAAAERVLALVQLTGWEERWPDELSGGMRQRVGLARALAGDPDILLMDEPFGALDPLIRRQLQDQFLELARVMRKTTLFITHDLDEAMRVGSRIAIMRDGRIVQVGTPPEIVRRPADAYVAEFVSGLSVLKLLHASDIMRPLAPDETAPEGAPTAGLDCPLASLAQMAAGSEHPVVILDGGGKPAGVVDKNAVLNSIRSEEHGGN